MPIQLSHKPRALHYYSPLLSLIYACAPTLMAHTALTCRLQTSACLQLHTASSVSFTLNIRFHTHCRQYCSSSHRLLFPHFSLTPTQITNYTVVYLSDWKTAADLCADALLAVLTATNPHY